MSMTDLPRFPPQDPRAQQHPGPQTTGRATAGVILCAIPGAITILIGLVLCILVLANPRDPGHGGRGRAWAGVALSAMWAVLLALVVVGSLSGQAERDTDGELTQSGQVTLDDLKVGDCLKDPLEEGEQSLYVDVTPCDTAHRGEVVAQFRLQSGDYPGEKNVQRLAEGGCQARIEKAVADPKDKTLQVYYLYPRAQDWTRTRRVDCLVTTKDDRTSTVRAGGA